MSCRLSAAFAVLCACSAALAEVGDTHVVAIDPATGFYHFPLRNLNGRRCGSCGQRRPLRHERFFHFFSALGLIGCTQPAFALRPFLSTDAEVVERRHFELEFGL